jgi:sulfur relay (sulfurtransferase) complex TusBCD TusD component (DsrE family)
MNNLGDSISEVKTKSGAPVTTCTSCPASIKCLATYTHSFQFKISHLIQSKQIKMIPSKQFFFLFYELNLPKAKQKTQNQNSIFFIDPVTHLAKNNEKPKKKMN